MANPWAQVNSAEYHARRSRSATAELTDVAEAEAAASPVMARTASAPLQGRRGRVRAPEGKICLGFLFPYRKKHNTIYIQNEIHYSNLLQHERKDKFLGELYGKVTRFILHKKKHEKHEVHVKTQRWRIRIYDL